MSLPRHLRSSFGSKPIQKGGPLQWGRITISSATFYAWKAKYGGLDVSQARKLKALEEENARLKKLLAEAMLDVAVLRDVTAKKW
jgi:hypothetical protein